MPMTNAGRDFIAAAIINDGPPTLFTNANAYIGVGSGSTAFAATQTDLQGASKTRKGMESGFPTRSNNELTFKSSFGTDDANHAWAEWGVFNASSSGIMLSRKVEDLGTKTTGTWVFTATLTLNIGS